ncbi:MAG: Isoprenylcysteine carboxyl methyltransferase (ICMT) family protein [Candidatus Methanoperedenaceae archaeon GB50]|nr:MAG: Isoprenylcysteine carboxyl methyltransferase (ICMT) family protein [Candidatus Methanoperedenaceae archaeon GB50]
MNEIFSVFLLSFMAIMTVHRILEMFLMTRKKKTGIIYKKWTLYALVVVHVLVGVFAVLEYFVRKRHINLFITGLGLAMFLGALILRNLAILTLGEFHSVQIELKNNHRLITNGVYGYIRHPYYLAVLFEVPSITLIPNSYYALLFSLLFYFPMLFYRIHSEELIMLKKFGHNYLRYKETVPAFFPISLLRLR